MKKIIATFLACAIAVCAFAVVSFADNADYRYALSSSSNVYYQGNNVTLKLSLTKDGNSFSYCELNAVIIFDFEVTDVSYTIPGQSATSTNVTKENPEEPASGSNPYKLNISYAPQVGADNTEGETASGAVTIAFKIADSSATGYKNISVQSLDVYVYQPLNNTSSDVSSEYASDNSSSNSDVSSDNASSSETSSESYVSSDNTSSEASSEQTYANLARNTLVEKVPVAISEKQSGDLNGKGKTLQIRVKNTNNANLQSLSVGEEFALSPEFASDTASYTVAILPETETVTITAIPVNEGATVTYEGPDTVSVSTEGIVTLSDELSQRVSIIVKSGQQTKNYYITFKRDSVPPVSSDPGSSTTSSEPESSEIPGLISSTENSSSEESVIPPVSSTQQTSGNNTGTGGIGVLPLILIIILSFVCGFVLCLILVNAGVIGGNKKDKEANPVDIDAFNKASAASKISGAYTATRVIPIPQTEKKQKFEINIEYDELKTEEPITAAATTSEKTAPKTTDDKIESTPKEEKKKKSFFFDDDEF